VDLKARFLGFDSDYLEMIYEQKKEEIARLEKSIKSYKQLQKDIKAELKRREDGGDYVGEWP
jgi:hypothetical protein